MNEIKELFHQDFNIKTCMFIKKNVIIAVEAFNRLLMENKIFFEYPLYSSVKGNLLNYSIEHCLYDGVFTDNVDFKAYSENVNGFGRSILNLRTDHFRMTAAKTGKRNKLPAPAKYKLEYASHNTNAEGQLYFDFIQNTVATPPYYALLTYGFNYTTQECTHITLVLPDSKFKTIVDDIDLLSSNMAIVPGEAEVDQTVVKLRPEFEKQIGKNN